jgi:hypothetical protein
MVKRYVASADARTQAHCAHCDGIFYQDRSTAKYCSDACKVAAHRERKAKKERYYGMVTSVRNLALELENKETSLNAAITLDSLRRTLDMYFPPKTRWWRCDCCGKAVMKFLPEAKDCQCAKPKWYIQAL